MAVVCACLPTLRPIWFHFYPKKVATTVDSNSYDRYGYGNGRKGGSGTAHSRSRGTGGIRAYTEIDEDGLELDDRPKAGRRDIVKQTVIAQTVDDVGDGSSSTTDLRPKFGSWTDGKGPRAI